MAQGHWLVKTEPSTYSWDDLVREKRTVWDGVRNPQARRNLAAMRKNDVVLVYHSGDEKAVVGVARVVAEAHPDPKDARWLAVDLEPVRPLAAPVPLARIKSEPALHEIPLVRQARLSVMPLPRAASERILRLGAGG
jgi:predicted RNA-binding protein with PUA-like domain